MEKILDNLCARCIVKNCIDRKPDDGSEGDEISCGAFETEESLAAKKVKELKDFDLPGNVTGGIGGLQREERPESEEFKDRSPAPPEGARLVKKDES